MGEGTLALRPLISGALGGIIAIWLCSRMAGWVLASRNGKPAGTLLRENRFSIWGANAVLLSGICLGAASYRLGYFDNADWRGLALGLEVDAWMRC